MGWLRSLIASSEENKRLRSERDFSRTRCETLEKGLSLANTRLLTEINSNRRREDAYRAEIAALQSPQMRLPFRDELEADTKIEVFDDGMSPKRLVQDSEDEWVEIRAKEYAQQYHDERGVPIDDVLMDVLRAKIRDNPSEYLSN